jgi:hypothetical protein
VVPAEEQPVPPRDKWTRRLVLAGIFGASAGLAVVAAYQEQFYSELGMFVIGFIALAATLWLVAWRRGAWTMRDDTPLLTFNMLGLILLTAGGPGLVTELVLTHRGAPIAVEVARASTDGDGGNDYTLVVPHGSTPLRGELHTSVEFAVGERFTVLFDRGRFVRPMLPEDVDPAFPALFVLAGSAILGITVLRFGFPLGTDRT